MPRLPLLFFNRITLPKLNQSGYNHYHHHYKIQSFNSTQLCHVSNTNVTRPNSTIALKTPEAEVQEPRTYQELVYNYLRAKDYWKEIDCKLNSECSSTDWTEIDHILSNIKLCDASNNIDAPSMSTLDRDLLPILPSYIFCTRARHVPQQSVNICDVYCSKILGSSTNISSLELIHAWLNHYHPTFNRIHQLLCFGKLMQQRSQEVLSLPNETISDPLVQLVFLSAMGKKSVECNEILNMLATLCDKNLQFTYVAINSFELGIICESFFKGGIRINSPKSLSHLSNTLCLLLSETLEDGTKGFDPFVVISLLKVLRQTNYIEEKLLRLLGELIVSPVHTEKVRSIRFITNIISAFVGPGKIHPIPDSKSDLSMVKILRRMEKLVIGNIRDEQTRPGESLDCHIKIKETTERNPQKIVEPVMVMKSRLKDISRWLWATTALGYELSSEIFEEDLNRRFNVGEFNKRPSDAVDALLALAIMNQYPEAIAQKILLCSNFRYSVKVNCSKRQKGRFALFLTAMKIERNETWNLSLKDENQWFVSLGTHFIESDAWQKNRFRVKPIDMFGTGQYFKPHTQLLNMCLDSLNELYSMKNGNTSQLRSRNRTNKITHTSPKLKSPTFPRPTEEAQVSIGYAVPFQFIPGIKIVSPSSKKEIFLEILDGIGISPTYHNFKLRLMERLKYDVIKVTRAEVEQCGDLVNFLNTIIARSKTTTSGAT